MIKQGLRDPIVHFVFIAAVLFIVNGVLNEQQREQKTIVIDQARIDWLRTSASKEMGREPNAAELKKLIENTIREEILFREAKALGLQDEDIIIRRRLVEKLQFLIEDVAIAQEPKEAELRNLYQDLDKQFISPERYSFSHIYFSKQSRATAKTDAVKLLQDLYRQPDNSKGGDPFMLPYQFYRHSQEQLQNSFGQGFSQSLTDLKPGQWQGPVESVYGWHLIKVSEKIPQQKLPFEQAREQVLLHWQDQRRKDYNHKTYQRLRKKYQVDISGSAVVET